MRFVAVHNPRVESARHATAHHLVFASQKRHERPPLNLIRRLLSHHLQQRRHYIHVVAERVNPPPRSQTAGMPDDERISRLAPIHRAPPLMRDTPVPQRHTVVRMKHDNRIVAPPARFQAIEQIPHPPIHLRHLTRVRRAHFGNRFLCPALRLLRKRPRLAQQLLLAVKVPVNLGRVPRLVRVESVGPEKKLVHVVVVHKPLRRPAAGGRREVLIPHPQRIEELLVARPPVPPHLRRAHPFLPEMRVQEKRESICIRRVSPHELKRIEAPVEVHPRPGHNRHVAHEPRPVSALSQ